MGVPDGDWAEKPPVSSRRIAACTREKVFWRTWPVINTQDRNFGILDGFGI
jgi:hypothetical protein